VCVCEGVCCGGGGAAGTVGGACGCIWLYLGANRQTLGTLTPVTRLTG